MAIAVLICLIVISMICATLVRSGLTQRESLKAEERRLQAEWLAESGLERAVARLARTRDYKGETWELKGEDLGGPAAGVVTIAVEEVASQPLRRRVRVQADFPRDVVNKARQSKQVTIELAPENTGEKRP